jgi:pimeloyl-ACP methyl ester carboxylesterase
MPIIKANGINLYYETQGEGQTLVLISGLGGDHLFWDPHVKSFAKHYRVLTFDNRGIGQTDIPDTPYSMEMMADDLAALLDHLEIKKAHILGFSMGGAIAQTFALRYSTKVDKLIICGSFAKMNSQIRLYLDAVLHTYIEGVSAQRFYELILPWLFSVHYLDKAENREKMAFNPNEPYPQPLHGFKWQYLALREFDVMTKIKSIKAPTLVIAGEKDAMAHLEDAHLIVQNIPNASLQVIPDTGHLFNYENENLFNKSVLDFLKC